MVDQKSPDRTAPLNAALEAIHFGYRALTAWPDERLAGLGYARVHHRVLYFIGRNPGCRVTELCAIMRVSKQYLHRPLARLLDDGLATADGDPADGRVKLLRLSPEGARLENELSGEQRRRFERIFAEAGPQAERGWRKVMALLALPDE